MEIMQWISKSLGILSWSKQKFSGERNVLTTPQPEELKRFRKFLHHIGCTDVEGVTHSRKFRHILFVPKDIQCKLF